MPSIKTILQVATVTMATMFIVNQVAARNSFTRTVFNGRPVSAVASTVSI